MVSKQDCNHDNFEQRAELIYKIFDDCTPQEVVAMGQADTALDGAKLMFDLWNNSPPHWQAVNGSCHYYCYSLGFKDGIYYGIGLIIK